MFIFLVLNLFVSNFDKKLIPLLSLELFMIILIFMFYLSNSSDFFFSFSFNLIFLILMVLDSVLGMSVLIFSCRFSNKLSLALI